MVFCKNIKSNYFFIISIFCSIPLFSMEEKKAVAAFIAAASEDTTLAIIVKKEAFSQQRLSRSARRRLRRKFAAQARKEKKVVYFDDEISKINAMGEKAWDMLGDIIGDVGDPFVSIRRDNERFADIFAHFGLMPLPSLIKKEKQDLDGSALHFPDSFEIPDIVFIKKAQKDQKN